MALVKDRVSSSCAYNGNANMGDLFPLHMHMGLEDGDSSSFEKRMSGLGSPSRSANSGDQFMFQAHGDAALPDSLIHFNGPFLSFQQKDNGLDYGNQQWRQVHPDCSSRVENLGCFQTATSPEEKGSHGDWLYSEPTAMNIGHESGGSKEPAASHKRPNTQGENMQSVKKQCNSPSKKSKQKSAPSKDPQSIAAKNRRERISERLKILQDLVPNGSKVDLVTMLEKAISYVKFLQVQVKVLATDEFWPSQGGKAPDISQVKEAIDAILSSQRERNSSSSTS